MHYVFETKIDTSHSLAVVRCMIFIRGVTEESLPNSFVMHDERTCHHVRILPILRFARSRQSIVEMNRSCSAHFSG